MLRVADTNRCMARWIVLVEESSLTVQVYPPRSPSVRERFGGQQQADVTRGRQLISQSRQIIKPGRVKVSEVGLLHSLWNQSDLNGRLIPRSGMLVRI